MNNKAQVTIFILVAIVLIIGTAYFLSTLPEGQKTITRPTPTAEVQNFIQSCLDLTVDEAALFVGLRGGAYELKEPIAVTYFGNSSLLFDGTKATYPTQESVSFAIENYLRAELSKCFNDFSKFAAEGIEVVVETASADVVIAEDKIITTLNMPTKFMLGDAITEVENFQSSTDIPLGYLMDVATLLLQAQENNPDVIDVTLADSFDARVEHLPAYGNLMITVIESEHYVNGQPLRFVYGSNLGGTA